MHICRIPRLGWWLLSLLIHSSRNECLHPTHYCMESPPPFFWLQGGSQATHTHCTVNPCLQLKKGGTVSSEPRGAAGEPFLQRLAAFRQSLRSCFSDFDGITIAPYVPPGPHYYCNPKTSSLPRFPCYDIITPPITM